MISRELFRAMFSLLDETHTYWKISQETQDIIHCRLNKMGVDDQAFGDLCMTLAEKPDAQPSNILEYFKQERLRASKNTALPAGDEAEAYDRAGRPCEEKVRCAKLVATIKRGTAAVWDDIDIADEDWAIVDKARADGVGLIRAFSESLPYGNDDGIAMSGVMSGVISSIVL